jgi:hypothetical protein
MQEATTFNIFHDGLSFQHLANELISVFTLCYGPGLLFTAHPVLCILYNLSRLLYVFSIFYSITSRDMWDPVTMAWSILRLWKEELPPIWRVAANILNRQLRTADKEWYSSLGVRPGVDNSSL